MSFWDEFVLLAYVYEPLDATPCRGTGHQPILALLERLGINIENLQFGDGFTETSLDKIRIKNGGKWNTGRKTFQSQFKEYGRHAIIGFFKLNNDAKIENPNFNE